MIITLPALESTITHTSRNKISHFIEQSISFEGDVLERNSHFVVLTNENTSCCFTDNENFAKRDAAYIILCSRVLTQDMLERDNLHFKRWIRHPKKRQSYDNVEIINSWKDAFHFKEEDLESGINGLRTPQIGAIHAILGHLKLKEEIANVILPTGTGKTETMLSVLISERCTKLLVLVPSVPLRKQIADKFKTLGYLKRFGIVDAIAINPIVGVLTTKFDTVEQLEQFFTDCNVIVSTMKIVADSPPDQVRKMAEICSHLFIDEAHHSKAKTWNKFISSFEREKVIQFTATPYRNDGERLNGKIVINFSLRKAQEQGYFREIEFLPIREYDSDQADQLIADTAVRKLRSDREAGHNHLLMARCNDKERARSVFRLYENHEDLNPVIIYSGLPGKDAIVERIKNLEHKIIVCVDMLGEGFDLPQLKIAAFHDIRKSLPITLQFAGRFTRTSIDDQLGNASFIANIYQPGVMEELEDLYARDSNWNLLLPGLSARNTQEQIDFQEFLSGFRNMAESLIPFQNIRPALSTVAYRNLSDTWNPRNFESGIRNINSYTHKFSDYNMDERTIVVLLGREMPVAWGNFTSISNIEWSLIVVFWESHNNILYIHGSDTSGHFKDLAEAVLGANNARLIKGMDVFRVFHQLRRVSLYNVGLKNLVIGKDLSFQSFIGRSVGEALNYLTRRQGVKNNVFGVGYEDGNKISLGCSQKGRIWSYARGNLKDLVLWCTEIGNKLIDHNIDPDIILQGTLHPESISTRPNVMPIAVDWDSDLYAGTEEYFEFRTTQGNYNVSTSELKITNPSLEEPLQFSFHTEEFDVLFQLDLTERLEGDQPISEFKVRKISPMLVTVAYSRTSMDIEAFFNEYVPTIWFADGSCLNGNHYVKLREEVLPFPQENITPHDWTGVNIRHESQHVQPKIIDSIQYHYSKKLVQEDYDIVYDDDYSGEIADLVAIKNNEDTIDIHLFHLKWAINGVVSNDIDNLYEVCGQAQKSIQWRYKEPDEIYHHLFSRITKRRAGNTCSRLEKGTEDDLDFLLRLANSEKPTKFHINIVQPSISQQNASDEILLLLGVTSSYLKDTAGIDLKVIASV